LAGRAAKKAESECQRGSAENNLSQRENNGWTGSENDEGGVMGWNNGEGVIVKKG